MPKAGEATLKNVGKYITEIQMGWRYCDNKIKQRKNMHVSWYMYLPVVIFFSAWLNEQLLKLMIEW